MSWDDIKSDIFILTGVENGRNADKLFVSLLQKIECSGIDIKKSFTIAKIADLIPKGTGELTTILLTAIP